MKPLSIFIYSLISISLFSITSCEKERVYPRINIQSPAAGSSYTYGDTIYVSANVENATSNIRINVLRGATVVALPAELYGKEGNLYTWRIFFNDKYVESGLYDVRVSALNGENAQSDFLELKLSGLSRQLKGVSIITQNSQESILHRMDSLNQLKSIVLPQAYDYVINRGEFQQILVAPAQSGGLKAYKFKSLDAAFIVQDLSENNKQYSGLFQFHRSTYALLYDGRVLGFGEEGNISNNFALDVPYYPIRADYGDGELAILAREGTLSQYRFYIVNTGSGAVKRQVFVPGTALAVSHYRGGVYFIIFQQGNDVKVAEYNTANNTLTNRITIQNEMGRAMTTAGNIAYIGTNKNLYSFDPENALSVNQVLNLSISGLKYDELQNELYFSVKNSLYSLSPGTQQQLYVFASADSIVDFDLMYNK